MIILSIWNPLRFFMNFRIKFSISSDSLILVYPTVSEIPYLKLIYCKCIYLFIWLGLVLVVVPRRFHLRGSMQDL